jgi:methylated-DNA-protein-cysteine methyltransferase-like protein
MANFTEKALLVIKSIPHGKVMTYGQIARACGQPRGARQVVRILHSMSEKHDLPWYRVINSQGQIAERFSEMVSLQKHLLESEGIVFSGALQICLEKYNFEPYLVLEKNL